MSSGEKTPRRDLPTTDDMRSVTSPTARPAPCQADVQHKKEARP